MNILSLVADSTILLTLCHITEERIIACRAPLMLATLRSMGMLIGAVLRQQARALQSANKTI
jgi:hypothetical protein